MEMHWKIRNLIILFKLYKAGPNSLVVRSSRSLTIITDSGESMIKGEWPNENILQYYRRVKEEKKKIKNSAHI